ncbi:hypothetical protein MKX01_021898 [Papaver californicum]|nr:hypothetical protein MKX01_029723 [Papaver californicum]KAI3987644.1 hypothetical protein MKX01_021898 [Papaver californicum]
MREDEAATARVRPPHTELYALLNISPEASFDEIRKAYRQWAQIYHPDKYQSPQMKDTATQNFQRICEAYEILTDENKRQIYDIYGMEGLNSGLEFGSELNKADEIKEEIERLKRRKEEEDIFSHVQPSGLVLADMSLPQFLDGGRIMQGMAMSSEVQSQITERNTMAIGGLLSVNNKAGGRFATAVLGHQVSSVASAEFTVSVGLQALIGAQMTRQLSVHSIATSGIAVSLRDGSVNLSNAWIQRLSETSSGNIQLSLGVESSIAVGWQKEEEKTSATGELKFGTSFVGASGQYIRHFSSKSHGRIAGKIGSTALEFEVGGGRKLSDFSSVRMFYTIGFQGISWRFEFHREGQRLLIPILLSNELNAGFAAGALVLPTSLYFVLKTFVLKPYFLKRERRKALEKSSAQVREARAKAEKGQQLLLNVANRKRTKQLEKDGLIIYKALYGNLKAFKGSESKEVQEEVASQIVDVTLPLNFLVTDSGQLKLHPGVKKSGIMGFCDPCPGEPKQLHVEYTYGGDRYEVYSLPPILSPSLPLSLA